MVTFVGIWFFGGYYSSKVDPVLFLAILNKSVSNHHVISLEKINMLGISSLSCLNTVHWYFRCKIDNLKISLQQDGAYSGVFGGVI